MDPLGQSLDDRRLSYPRVADQHGIVLRLARQDLDDATDLAVATDHRIEATVPGVRDQVAAVLFECLVGNLRHRGGDPLVASNRGERGQEVIARDARLGQQASGRRPGALVEQSDDKVLHRDVLVLQPLGLFLGRVEEAGQSLGHHHLARCGARTAHRRSAAQLLLDRRAQELGICPRLCEQAWHERVGILEQREEEMLAVDLAVAVTQRLRLRVVQSLLRLLRELVHVHDEPPGV